jgi:FemAB-related protein (PEP-CTERM system-associated)
LLAAVNQLTPGAVAHATDVEAKEWNEFVRSHPNGSFCHLWAWGAFFRECFGHRPRYYVARDEAGKIDGVLPLIHMRSLFGKCLISMPYLNYGGPIGSPQAQAVLLRHAREDAVLGGVKQLEFRNRGIAPDGLPPRRSKVTVVLPLPATVDALWETTFRAKLRSQIRRAQKEEMEVRFGPDQLRAFYAVFSRNMRDLGTPVLPLSFFSGLLRHFGEMVCFGVVYSQTEPVAAGCGFVWNGEFEMTWASSLREYNAMAPNMLLYSSFMEEMIRRGVGAFNFGRCTPGGGTHRFKLQWGGQDEPLQWSGWPDDHEDGDEPSAALQLASRVWQRLPLRIAEALGPIVSARLPQY